MGSRPCSWCGNLLAVSLNQVYHVSEYTWNDESELSAKRSEFDAAISITLFAAFAESISRLLMFPIGTEQQYAVALAMYIDGGSLTRLALLPFFVEPLSPFQLAAAAAGLWGGLNAAGWGVNIPEVDESTLGWVAPHCILLKSFLIDPWSFAKQTFEGPIGPILHLYRGSVPMLSRDANTGRVRGGDDVISQQTEHETMQGLADQPVPKQIDEELVLDFEHWQEDLTRVTMCFWLGGRLVRELDPCAVLHNLSGYTSQDYKAKIRALPERICANQVQWIPQKTLLSQDLGSFSIPGRAFFIFDTHGMPSWTLFAAGWVSRVYKTSPWDIVTVRGPVDEGELRKLAGDRYMKHTVIILCK
jgi:hypothetical protein